jgi:hypothetical protein
MQSCILLRVRSVSQLRSLSIYALVPFLTGVAPLVAIPAIIQAGGSDGWSAVAIGQGFGMAAGVAVLWGWAVVGPTEVARVSTSEQGSIYFESILSRAVLLLILVPTVLIATSALVEVGWRLVACGSALALTLQGMGPGWFLIGQSRPGRLLAVDTGPRTLGTLGSAGVVMASGQVGWYPALTCVVEVGISVAGAFTLATVPTSWRASMPIIVRRLRTQFPLAAAALFSDITGRLAVPVVSLANYSVVPEFAILSRFAIFARAGLRPFLNVLQVWVARPDVGSARRRRIATIVTVGSGAAIALLLAVALPLISERLFSGEVPVSRLGAAFTGLGVLGVGVSYSMTLYYLIPDGRVRAVSISHIIPATLSLPLILIMAARHGSNGAMAAIALSAMVTAAWQVGTVRAGRFDHLGQVGEAVAEG